jgi:hypothetical protein
MSEVFGQASLTGNDRARIAQQVTVLGMMAWALWRGYNVKNDHEADAVAIMLMAAAELEHTKCAAD